MNINRIIERTDEISPNVLSDEMKFEWVSTLDSRINREILKNDEDCVYKCGADGEKELLVPFPSDELYIFYVSAMIDFTNNEIGSYNNNMAVFNNRLSEFAKAYIRNNTPKKSGGFINII